MLADRNYDDKTPPSAREKKLYKAKIDSSNHEEMQIPNEEGFSKPIAFDFKQVANA